MILASSTSGFSLIMWIVILVAMMYFLMIRPQNKEQKRKKAMLSAMAVGDTVLTTSGFYGTIIDVQDDMVIVEFGSNRNCRIPMQKAAIADIEKPEDAAKAPVETKAEKKVEKKDDAKEEKKGGLFKRNKDKE